LLAESTQSLNGERDFSAVGHISVAAGSTWRQLEKKRFEKFAERHPELYPLCI
jgi:hypothetical protein